MYSVRMTDNTVMIMSLERMTEGGQKNLMRTKKMNDTWVLCPICGGKTRTKIKPDTEAKNLPIFCKICKNEVVMDIKDMEVRKSDCK